MWGYPFLFLIFGYAIAFFQVIVAYFVGKYLHGLYDRAISGRFPGLSAGGKNFLFYFILAPWFFLAISYSSCAVTSLMFVAAYVVLIGAAESPKMSRECAKAGLFLGLAYNFRAEAAYIAVLIFSAIVVYGLIHRRAAAAFKAAFAFMLVFSACATPYLIYTKITLGTPRLTSTNGGAVLYQTLGVLPDNPWGIVPTDEFVDEEARKFTNQGPWGAEADAVFADRFKKAVRSHPAAFAHRMLVGVKRCLIMGLQIPNIEEILNLDEEESLRIDFARQEFKSFFGLPLNPNKQEFYKSRGFDRSQVPAADWLLILCEVAVRAVYAVLWIVLCIFCLIKLFRSELFSWISLMSLCFLSFLMLSMAISVSFARITTMYLPIVLIYCASARTFGKIPERENIAK
jgi:hypothetical protein